MRGSCCWRPPLRAQPGGRYRRCPPPQKRPCIARSFEMSELNATTREMHKKRLKSFASSNSTHKSCFRFVLSSALRWSSIDDIQPILVARSIANPGQIVASTVWRDLTMGLFPGEGLWLMRGPALCWIATLPFGDVTLRFAVGGAWSKARWLGESRGKWSREGSPSP